MKAIGLYLSVLCALAAPAALGTGAQIIIGEPAAGNAIPWNGETYSSCRFQALWLQSDIDYGGFVNAVEVRKADNTSGRFDNVRIWLCHTGPGQLGTNFNNNYDGNTPTSVKDANHLTLAGTGWFDLGITPDRFNYNNADNLLMEIRWAGDNGKRVLCYRTGTTPPRRLYAWNDSAGAGTLANDTQHVRLTIGTMAALEPSSWGRVKALYR
jgi:hypothetical protein